MNSRIIPQNNEYIEFEVVCDALNITPKFYNFFTKLETNEFKMYHKAVSSLLNVEFILFVYLFVYLFIYNSH